MTTMTVKEFADDVGVDVSFVEQAIRRELLVMSGANDVVLDSQADLFKKYVYVLRKNKLAVNDQSLPLHSNGKIKKQINNIHVYQYNNTCAIAVLPTGKKLLFTSLDSAIRFAETTTTYSKVARQTGRAVGVAIVTLTPAELYTLIACLDDTPESSVLRNKLKRHVEYFFDKKPLATS